jgi:hypothetical protein
MHVATLDNQDSSLDAAQMNLPAMEQLEMDHSDSGTDSGKPDRLLALRQHD